MMFPEVAFCETPSVLKVINFFRILLTICCYFIPFIISFWTMYDLFKIITSDEDNKSAIKKSSVAFLKRIFAGVIAVCMPSLFEGIMSLGDTSLGLTEYVACYTNSSNITYYQEVFDTKQSEMLAANRTEEEEKIKEASKSTSTSTTLKKQYMKTKVKTQQTSNKTNDTSSEKSTNTSLGKKHQLTDAQYKKIAAMCIHEQGGSEAGIKAEASLMANRFELFGSKYSNVYEYVTKSGWFASKNANPNEANAKQVQYVKDVLQSGQRTLPGYVDEHDCIYCGKYGYDIVKIKTGSTTITDKTKLKDRSNYVSEKTVLYNKYGSTYTFYSFPTSTSDPFGYTASAYKKYKG